MKGIPMQYDMHYYGTYAMAVAAASPKPMRKSSLPLRNSSMTRTIRHGYSPNRWRASWALQLRTTRWKRVCAFFWETAEGNDTRLVWVPFHFMPGGEGRTFEEKLVCTENSVIVNKVFEHYISPSVIKNHRPHALHLIGIWAHTYADTFSHQGFSADQKSFQSHP